MKKLLGMGLLVGLLLTLSISPAIAHEGREVGDYIIEFGWRVEPAYTTLLNGAELTIENHDTEKGVDGAEATLALEITFGPASKKLKLYPVGDKPGHYTADLIPMQPGDYTFRLTGTLGETTIDETFSAADGQFSSVNPISDIQFP